MLKASNVNSDVKSDTQPAFMDYKDHNRMASVKIPAHPPRNHSVADKY